MKRKSLGIGMLAMCVTIVYGQQTRYYEAVICGDALLHVARCLPNFEQTFVRRVVNGVGVDARARIGLRGKDVVD